MVSTITFFKVRRTPPKARVGLHPKSPIMKSLTVRWPFLPLLIFLFLASSCDNEDDNASPSSEITDAQLDNLLEETMLANANVPGMIALVDIPDQISWSGAAGTAQYETGVPMATDHQFFAASLTKVMTATIILQLMEQEAFTLYSPVADWLDIDLLDSLTTFNGVAYGEELTFRHLLNHTSGIYDYLDNGSVHLEAFANDPERRYTLEDRVAIALERGSAMFRPGVDYFYSNTNYILLGMVIEAVTGRDIAEVFQERIFDPTGMTNTYLKPTATDLDRLCHGYYQDFDVTNFSTNFNYGSSAGGVVSTVDDLHSFMQYLSSGNMFLRSSTLELMKSFNYAGSGFGLKSFFDREPFGLVWGYDGADPGYYCYMLYLEKQEGIIVFAGNRAEIEVDDTAYFVNKVIEALAQQ